ncbi:MAG: DUF4091 domain-containing protein [Kiritimatiellae bacterium]|nr:DUF4091 domain-containing protein [Kiritimatiellia bacterium]
MTKTTRACLWAVLAVSAAFAKTMEPDWDVNVWEAKTPVLATPPAEEGFRGRVAPLSRIAPANATGEESRSWKGVAWRNERVYAQFVVWSKSGERQLRAEPGDLVSESGAKIPASAVKARMVRYVRSELTVEGREIFPEEFVAELSDDPSTTDTGWLDMPENGFRPVWVTIHVPKYIPAGVYSGPLTVRAAGDRKVVFDLELDVRDMTLPDPKDWKFHFDVWQHPWAVARYHHVEPFSEDHYRVMRPLMEELAATGQKVITTTPIDLAHGHQNFDAYRTMIEHVKNPDGSWTFDYSIFDSYVEYALSCGIGPKIVCYQMTPRGNIGWYKDGATGDKVSFEMDALSPGYEAFWGPFLADFQKHLEAKGWVGETYIGMDERSIEEIRATYDLVRRYSPKLKIEMAGDHNPKYYEGVEVESYAQSLQPMTDEFIADIPSRRAKGFLTTFYVCCTPCQPNTFVTSPVEESRWLGLYAAAKGFDGMLRWSVWNWPRDPLFDSSYLGMYGRYGWTPGDAFILYPNGRTSLRWDMLRESIENFEKIRILRESGRMTPELESALGKIDYKATATCEKPACAYDAEARAVEDAIDAASR